MNEMKMCCLVVLCIVLLFPTLGLAGSDFRRHELDGKFGASTIELTWSEPLRLRGSMSGGGIRHADCSWVFSEDSNSIKVTTTIAGISSSYLIKLEGKVYHGLAPSGFGVGQDVKLSISPDKITGRVGLDKIDIGIDPPLKKGEIPELDWIFEEG